MNISIDIEKYPLLNQIKEENREEVVRLLFDKGYTLYSKSLEESVTSQDILFDTIKNYSEKQNHLFSSSVEQIMTEQKQISTELQDLCKKFTGIIQNSSSKGILSQNIILNYLQERFPDYTITDTSQTDHIGDILIETPQHKQILLEIKNYSINVNQKEIDKFKRDLIEQDIHIGVIISLRTAFVRKKRFEIERFHVNNQEYFIVYVPHINQEWFKIDVGIILAERLFDLQQKESFQDVFIKKIEKLKHLISSFDKYEQKQKSLVKDFQDQIDMFKDLKMLIQDEIQNLLVK
jgi:hypothetical protein